MFSVSSVRVHVTSAVAALAVVLSGLFGFASPAQAANTSELVITYADLQFILKQIQISEAHATKETGALGTVIPATSVLGTGVNDVPYAGLPWGLRTVDGSMNNLIPGKEQAGAADQLFPRMAPAQFVNTLDGTSYTPANSLTTITDRGVRTISNLIAEQGASNPAAVTASGGAVPPVPIAGQLGDPSLPILNTNPAALAPTNSMFTFFGQFFDHGLDLVGKQSTSFVALPIPQDGTDPLAGTGTIYLNRTDYSAAERAQGVAVTTAATNKTTPWIDQNQTYGSTASKQVFMREYTMVGGVPVSTGNLLTGAGTAIANWGEVKAQAAQKLGILLTDATIGSVPLILTNEHGRFLPGPNGLPQVVFPGNVIVEGNLAAPISVDTAVSTGHAFLDDIAHNAAPRFSAGVLNPDTNLTADGIKAVLAPVGSYDNELLDAHYITGDGRGNENIGLTAIHTVFHAEHNRLVAQINTMIAGLAPADAVKLGFTDANGWGYGERLFQAARVVNEMEYQHLVFDTFARRIEPSIRPFLAYDPTLNPDITAEYANAVYRFGHSMLNENILRTNANGTANNISLFDGFLNPVNFTAGYASATEAAGAVARGSVTQVGNEIDEFVTGTLRNNLVGIPLDLASLNIARGRDTGIPTLNNFRKALFAQTQLASLTPYTSWNDFARNLRNPSSLQNFIAAYGTFTSQRPQFGAITLNTTEALLDSGEWTVNVGATARLGQGMAAANRVDVTASALVGSPASVIAEVRQSLVGAAIQCHVFVNNVQVDTVVGGTNLASISVAAGGTVKVRLGAASAACSPARATAGVVNRSLTNAAMRADAALAMANAAFMNATGTWTTANSGLDNVDLWIGGLAETRGALGGLLGSTFTHVFKQQMENLQEGDRFYYIGRLAGTNLLVQVQNNTLADLFVRNTGASNLPANFFDAVQQSIDYVAANNPRGVYPLNVSMAANCLTYTGALSSVFIGRDLAAAGGNDCMRGGTADDTLRGFDGNDTLDGFLGNDSLHGGLGNDMLIDTGTAADVDIALGGSGDDYLATGAGADIDDGGAGNDFILLGPDGPIANGGTGNDVFQGGFGVDTITGDEGDDWLDGGRSGDLLTGDAIVPLLGVDALTPGRDVLVGGDGPDAFDGGGAMDIFAGGDASTIAVNADTAVGGAGFDWMTYALGTWTPAAAVGSVGSKRGVVADLMLTARNPADIGQLSMDLFIDGDVEALSGGNGHDTLSGDDRTNLLAVTGVSDKLTAADQATVTGLAVLLTAGADGTNGNILLGGGGDDTIMGRGGNDIIDGDAYLSVKLQHNCTIGAVWTDATLAQIQALIAAGTIAGTCTATNVRIVREILTAAGANDTAVFRGTRAQYVVTLTAPGVYEVSGPDGTDVVRNIEFLQFDDTKLTPAQAVGAQVPSMYAPTNVQGVASGTQVTVTWTAPSGPGMDTVTGYQVEVWDGSAWTTPLPQNLNAAARSYVATGLLAGTSYRFRVLALYGVTTGPASAEVSVTTDGGGLVGISYPAPTNLTGTSTTTSVTLNWTAPANPSVAIAGYKVWKSTDNVQWSAAAPDLAADASSVTVTGLNSGTPYLFTVAALYGAVAPFVTGSQTPAVLVSTVAVPVGGGGGGGFFPPAAADPGITSSTPTVVTAPSGSTSSFTTLTAPTSFKVALPNGSNALVTLPVGAVSGAGTVTVTASQPQAGVITLDVRVNAGGNSVTQFTQPLEINLGKVDTSAAVVTSVNGMDWTKIPLLSGTTLPAGQQDGYYIAANGDVIVLTRHLTYFGAKLQQSTLTVDLGGALPKVGDKVVVKTSGGSGSGAITFASTTSSICSVATDGTVVALAEGVCSITAKRAGDTVYLGSESAAVQLKVAAASATNSTTTSTKPSIKVTSAGSRRTLSISVGDAYAGMRADVQIRKAGTVGFKTTARLTIGSAGTGKVTVSASAGSTVRVSVAGRTLVTIKIS